ncbi:MAG TPA: helix-hairpin-helix domain-containing protein [Blastocatellia bacterium]|nr:helix-hairpin-helix domain-containing protein [Blastocatellia bacterium]
MEAGERLLKNLASVGPAALRDFELLGIRNIEQLADQSAIQMYERLCSIREQRIDICCLDVFNAAIAQARDPNLPSEQRQWWYWSRKRKARQ